MSSTACALADWKGDPSLADGSFPVIHKFSGGVPRRINTLCSRLLLYGFLEGLHTLDDIAVEKVGTDMDRELAVVKVEHQPPSADSGRGASRRAEIANASILWNGASTSISA